MCHSPKTPRRQWSLALIGDGGSWGERHVPPNLFLLGATRAAPDNPPSA
jgi:hypothetical protein